MLLGPISIGLDTVVAPKCGFVSDPVEDFAYSADGNAVLGFDVEKDMDEDLVWKLEQRFRMCIHFELSANNEV